MHLCTSMACPGVPPPREMEGIYPGWGSNPSKKPHPRDRGNGQTVPPRGRVRPLCLYDSVHWINKGNICRFQFRVRMVNVPHPRNPPRGQIPQPRVKRGGQIPRGSPGLAIDRCIISCVVVNIQQVSRQQCEQHQCEARSANANSAKETTGRMRQKCEGQVCEGQECECNFSASGQNAEMIQIVRSRSFCLQDGVWFKKKRTLSLSVFISRDRVGVKVGSLSPTDRWKTGRWKSIGITHQTVLALGLG